MDHSTEGYLNRRTTAELEIIANAEDQEISEEIKELVTQILQNRAKSKK